MSDILSNFLESDSSLKRKNKYKNKFSAKLNKIFLDNGLRLSKEGNMIKLPKLNINNRFITENYKNKSYDNLESSIKNDQILIINNTDTENNNILKNQHLYDVGVNNNIERRSKIFNKYLNKYYNKNSKSNNKNKYKPKILTIDNNNIIFEDEKEKKKFIDNYINSLLTKGKEKSDKFSEATKKIESNKFTLANSINPKMYIQKKI